MFEASIVPSAPPAPMIVCNSSIKRIIFFLSLISFIMRFKRSSNSPRYFVPAITDARSRVYIFLLSKCWGTVFATILCAKPSTIAVFPTPGSPTNMGLFFVRRERICTTLCISFSRPTTGSISPSRAFCVISRLNSFRNDAC